jgi:hypothetical protein
VGNIVLVKFIREEKGASMKRVAMAAAFVTVASQMVTAQAVHANVTARRANDFVETVGVATHFAINGGARQYGTQPATILQKIKNLGVRYYRGYWQNSYRDYGLKGMAFVDTRNASGQLDANDINNSLNRYTGYERDLLAIEGPNEYDLTGRANWAPELRDYMLSLKNAVRARTSLNGIPILGPSLITPDNFAALGNLSDRSDLANAHAYSGHMHPESYWFNLPSNGLFIDSWKNKGAASHPGQPMWVTETGYNEMSEDAKAKYTPRHYMWYFMRGIQRTMTYEMVSPTDPSDNWGLLRADLSETPAYTSLKNTMTILQDNNATFASGTLQYSVSGDTTNLQQCLLQKGNGTYYLVLWQAAISWNRDTKTDTPAPSRSVTLNLSTRIGTARTYLPKSSASATNTYTNPTSISLSVPDHILIVELSPSTTSNAPIGKRIALRAKANNRIVCADNYGSLPLAANRDSVGPWESFDVFDGGSGTICLKAVANGKFVAADNYGNSPLIAKASSIGSWEKFYWLSNSDGTISLRAAVNNKIVCADNYGSNPRIANRDGIGDWEKFNFSTQ